MLSIWLPCELLSSAYPFSVRVRVLIPLQVTDRPGIGTPEQVMVPSEPQLLYLPTVSWEFVVFFQNKQLFIEV